MSGWALVGLLIVLFVGWHFFPKSQAARPSPRFRRDLRVNASDPRWRQFIEEHCESPAETAFLKAMIEAHEFRPAFGSLQADGLKLDLQVQEGPYRVDFLANDWLVIEIDGAAYHSSEEAKARDRQRDDYFEGLGYSVLRIPAKVVFADPDEAVRRVGSALTAGKRIIASPVQENGFERLGQTMAGLNRVAGKINDDISRKRKIEAALSHVRRAASTEKDLIDNAIAGGMRELEIREYIGESDERRKSYDDFDAILREAVGNSRPKHATSVAQDCQAMIKVPLFSPPLYSGDAEIDSSVMAFYRRIEEDRENYLETARQKVRADPRLGPLVKNMLARMGCPEVWASIS